MCTRKKASLGAGPGPWYTAGVSALELRHLRTICAVAEAHSLTRAASALGLTQPALAAQLHRIEALLGGTIFERTGTGCQPTKLGREVVALATRVLTGAEQLVALAQSAGRRRSGLALGIEHTGFLGDLLTELRAFASGGPVRTRTELSAGPLLRLLARDELHLAVFYEFPGLTEQPPRGVELRELINQPLFLMLAQTHPLARRALLDLGDVRDLAWVTPPPDTDSLRRGIDLACARYGFTPRRSHYAMDARAARDLVRAGSAVALAAPTTTDGEGVVVRRLRDTPLRCRLYMATRTEGPCSAYRRELYACVARAYRAAVDRAPLYAQWWVENPSEHAELDATIAVDRTLSDMS
ncbi:LysR family transcription regulator [Kutzneria albida DSM 43870]|uniref:LysR family transcription regulator n=1 Tax=Kutzneria albida DSM 43870 TaxID=1449976 RepID=W5W7I8_9PSEU|nr:LysR family transcription regulator [Kutzneria albida DSM 43870]